MNTHRAALVALPPPSGRATPRPCAACCGPRARMLLQTFACHRPPGAGLPYRVPEEEVRALSPGAGLLALAERPSTPEGWSAVTYRLDMP